MEYFIDIPINICKQSVVKSFLGIFMGYDILMSTFFCKFPSRSLGPGWVGGFAFIGRLRCIVVY